MSRENSSSKKAVPEKQAEMISQSIFKEEIKPSRLNNLQLNNAMSKNSR